MTTFLCEKGVVYKSIKIGIISAQDLNELIFIEILDTFFHFGAKCRTFFFVFISCLIKNVFYSCISSFDQQVANACDDKGPHLKFNVEIISSILNSWWATHTKWKIDGKKQVCFYDFKTMAISNFESNVHSIKSTSYGRLFIE